MSSRGGGAALVCSNGIYGELVPLLNDYTIAKDFCSLVYPAKCTIIGKRAPAAPSTTTTVKITTTTTTKMATTTVDQRASAPSKAKSQGTSVLSTLCSCIETPKACATTMTTTTKVTTTASSTTTAATTTTTTAAPAPLCPPSSGFYINLTTSSGSTYATIVFNNINTFVASYPDSSHAIQFATTGTSNQLYGCLDDTPYYADTYAAGTPDARDQAFADSAPNPAHPAAITLQFTDSSGDFVLSAPNGNVPQLCNTNLFVDAAVGNGCQAVSLMAVTSIS